MSGFLVLVVHFIVTGFRLAKPGGPRSALAESVLVRHQLLILNRGRKRAPNLHAADRSSLAYARFSFAGHDSSALPSF